MQRGDAAVPVKYCRNLANLLQAAAWNDASSLSKLQTRATTGKQKHGQGKSRIFDKCQSTFGLDIENLEPRLWCRRYRRSFHIRHLKMTTSAGRFCWHIVLAQCSSSLCEDDSKVIVVSLHASLAQITWRGVLGHFAESSAAAAISALSTASPQTAATPVIRVVEPESDGTATNQVLDFTPVENRASLWDPIQKSICW